MPVLVPYPDPGSRSARLDQRARRVLPGGASRGTVTASPYPVFVAGGEGAWVSDVDGHRYVDVNNNFTAIVLGHAHPAVTAAVQAQVARGASFALPCEAEVALAELLCGRVPSIERIRFTTSGTEAVMVAVKAARAFTGRPAVAKVEGGYHGGYDHAEVSLAAGPDDWGPATAPSSVPYARGTPPSVGAETVVLPFNDAAAAQALVERNGHRLAAVVLDTLPSRVGMPAPQPAFLDAVTGAARSAGALVICDEVITFRLGPAGHQGLLGLAPDLTTLGKVIGGGFPVGAVGGRAEVMGVFDAVDGHRPAVPAGGTFAAHPVTMAAGLTCMELLTGDAFARLAHLGEVLRAGLRSAFAAAEVGWQVTGAGSLFRIHPHRRLVRSYRDSRHTGAEATTMAELQRRLLQRQVLTTTSGMGCATLAMGPAEVDHVMAAVADAISEPFEHGGAASS
jgi:glutamate-1-semialdehyde 2,1-aminomutase